MIIIITPQQCLTFYTRSLLRLVFRVLWLDLSNDAHDQNDHERNERHSQHPEGHTSDGEEYVSDESLVSLHRRRFGYQWHQR